VRARERGAERREHNDSNAVGGFYAGANRSSHDGTNGLADGGTDSSTGCFHRVTDSSTHSGTYSGTHSGTHSGTVTCTHSVTLTRA